MKIEYIFDGTEIEEINELLDGMHRISDKFPETVYRHALKTTIEIIRRKLNEENDFLRE